jgi:hypothetical protein
MSFVVGVRSETMFSSSVLAAILASGHWSRRGSELGFGQPTRFPGWPIQPPPSTHRSRSAIGSEDRFPISALDNHVRAGERAPPPQSQHAGLVLKNQMVQLSGGRDGSDESENVPRT